ncbi:hypothetical protein ACJX0J_016351, partial [Zea mays]
MEQAPEHDMHNTALHNIQEPTYQIVSIVFKSSLFCKFQYVKRWYNIDNKEEDLECGTVDDIDSSYKGCIFVIAIKFLCLKAMFYRHEGYLSLRQIILKSVVIYYFICHMYQTNICHIGVKKFQWNVFL